MAFDHRIFRHPESGFVVDLSDAPTTGEVDLRPALAAMQALEDGAIANPSEQRQVGHYWLRDPDRAPSSAITAAIRAVHTQVDQLQVGDKDTVLLVGIGGSALGAEFAFDALATTRPTRRLVVLDTVDPAGMAHLLHGVDPHRTVALITSKSGSTAEIRTGLRAVEAHWAQAGACFADHAIAITGPNSGLEDMAKSWLATFPVWEWVGGRTSLTSAVGLVPMTLCGLDATQMLAGARQMDAWTRNAPDDNPAAQLAAAWWVAGNGQGDRALVIEPYINRFRGLSRYIQQLVMESVGKGSDREGNPIKQGLTVYGNKGSADQHALLQQLQEGRDDAFVHFVSTRHTAAGSPLEREAADLQLSLLEGTRDALTRAGRPSVTFQLPEPTAHCLGALLALFERAVGLYAELANINAYDQPGVERSKRAAARYLEIHSRLLAALDGTPKTADTLATEIGLDPGRTWRILTHLATTNRAKRSCGKGPSEDTFSSNG